MGCRDYGNEVRGCKTSGSRTRKRAKVEGRDYENGIENGVRRWRETSKTCANLVVKGSGGEHSQPQMSMYLLLAFSLCDVGIHHIARV
jgi:hypothetical protein